LIGVSAADIATASSDPERYGLCAGFESVTIVAPLDRNSHGGQRIGQRKLSVQRPEFRLRPAANDATAALTASISPMGTGEPLAD
jgi:hypothetical protein